MFYSDCTDLGHMAIPGNGRVAHPNTNQMNEARKLLPRTNWDAIRRKIKKAIGAGQAKSADAH